MVIRLASHGNRVSTYYSKRKWAEGSGVNKAKQIDDRKTKSIHHLLFSQMFWAVGGWVEEAQELRGQFDSVTSQLNSTPYI